MEYIKQRDCQWYVVEATGSHLSTGLTSDSQNALAPVCTSLPPLNAIVDTNKLDGANVTQQPKGLPVVRSW